MSAFIVSNKTIDHVIGLVRYLSDRAGDKQLHPAVVKLFKVAKIGDGKWALLGQELLYLNTRAVNLRYRERQRAGTYTFNPAVADTTYFAQAYKSLNCLLYQCTEGKIPNTKIYRALDRLGELACKKYVTESKEYSNALWD